MVFVSPLSSPFGAQIVVKACVVARRYDDVPDASQEDVAQYPRVLATFFQQAPTGKQRNVATGCYLWPLFQGYPYMNGVRRLMEPGPHSIV